MPQRRREEKERIKDEEKVLTIEIHLSSHLCRAAQWWAYKKIYGNFDTAACQCRTSHRNAFWRKSNRNACTRRDGTENVNKFRRFSIMDI